MNTMHAENTRIVMLGDSITFAGNWQELLQRGDVYNAGMPGWTSGDLLRIAADCMLQQKPVICFYMAGINDYSMGYPTDRIVTNGKSILDTIIANGALPVYQTLLYQRGSSFINSEIDLLNKNMQAFCLVRGYEFLDLRPLLSANGDLKEEFTYDGTHLSGHAYIPWAEAIRPVLIRHEV